MLVFLSPGQGAQAPGFLTPWLDVPTTTGTVGDRLRWWSAVVGIDLVAAGTTWDTAQIRDTAVAQPLLLAGALASAEALLGGEEPAEVAGALAGHSVGEFAAAVLAGALTAESGLVLVRERGRAMAEAAAVTATGMAAVLGGDPDVVHARLDELGLTAANRNGAGQIVAAGTLDQLAALRAEPPAGSRVRPLEVAGAFHTTHMSPATQQLAALATAVPVADPRGRLLSNADGGVVRTGTELLARLVAQVEAPVRWDACLETLGALGTTATVELLPGGTLTGLVRRALPGVETVALRTPDDLPAARALLHAHAHHVAHRAAGTDPAWRLVVAPVGGTFHPATALPGTVLLPGSAVGRIASRREDELVPTPYGGVLLEWLAEEGDPVIPGQPLARLHPEAVA